MKIKFPVQAKEVYEGGWIWVVEDAEQTVICRPKTFFDKKEEQSLAEQLVSLINHGARYPKTFPYWPKIKIPMSLYFDWLDITYGNDICPSMGKEINGKYYHLWIDYPNPKEREEPEHKQFALYKCNEDWEVDHDKEDPLLIETESEEELLKYIKEKL